MGVVHGDFISDGGLIWRAEDTRLYGNIADIPNFYERESLFSVVNLSEKAKLTLPDRLLVNIGNRGYILEESITLNLNSTSYYDADSYAMATPLNRAGKDIYIYAVRPEDDNDEVPKFILSTNSTVPTDYTSTTSRKIGGFHCLCKEVGGIGGHTLSGYNFGDILPLSIWDLRHRPVSEPEGMVYVKGINKWVDIYLNSWDGIKLVSRYNGVIADGGVNNGHAFNGEKFVEKLGLIGKRLPTRNEFMVFAKGSNEGTNITGSADPGTAGGHLDSMSRRMISNYGAEDCNGVAAQWTDTLVESTDNYSYHAENSYFEDYTYEEKPVFNPIADIAKYGTSRGYLRRLVVGGRWNETTNCGSRAVDATMFSGATDIMISARGVSEPKY